MDRNLKMVRGDTFAFGIQYEIDGGMQDLESCDFSCRKNPDDENYIFHKTLSDGISKVSSGKYRVRVAPEDTDGIDIGNYYYDLQIGLNDDVFTIIKGVLKIEMEITR